jgi:hypothetical protein
VGLAVGIVLIAKVFFELSYDSFYKDIDRVHSIRTWYSQHGDEKDYGQVSGAVGKQVFITGHGPETDDDNVPFYFTISGVYKSYLIGNLEWADTRPSVLFRGAIDSPSSSPSSSSTPSKSPAKTPSCR